MRSAIAFMLPVMIVSHVVEARNVAVADADVAVAPFTVRDDSAGALRSLADTCLERLIRALKAEGVAVARYPRLSEKDLASVRPVPLAVLGELGRQKDQVRAELRLMEVDSGEELRSYFNTDSNRETVANLGVAAAKRIALVVRERKGTE